jgi:hemerythrin
MRHFQWTSEHAVFQPEFDAEHRELFRLGEDLQHAVETDAAAATVEKSVRLLASELEAHLAHEERVMRSAGYSGYEWHKRQHDTARRRVKALAADPDELLRYLAGWFRDHTGVADRMMAASLRNQGRGMSAGTAS